MDLIMKKFSLSLIAIFCLAMPCLAFVLTAEDIAWADAMNRNLGVIAIDQDLIST
jgi:hypothetical protein